MKRKTTGAGTGVLIAGYSTNAVAQTAALTSAVAAIATGDWATQVFGIPTNVLFACFCGAAIALRFLPKSTRWGMFSSVLIGTIAAGYTTPALADLWEIKRLNAIGFGSGLLAYTIIALIFAKGEKLFLKHFGGE